MTATRMSTLVWLGTALTLAGMFEGCISGKSRAGTYDSKPAAALPIYPSSAEYKSRDGAGQPQMVQQNAPRGGCCSSGSCAMSRGPAGGACGCGSCGMNRATPPAAQPGPPYGATMADNRPVQQNAPPTGAGQYGGQKTCPVTGEALGSMGPPVPVTVKGQTIYVCCQGCVETVQSDPDVYLAKAVRERSGQ